MNNNPIPADMELLKEMVRLAEIRRTEAFNTIERINKYNLAIIAFCGSFLSLLVSTNMPIHTLRLSGASLVVSILISLYAVRPGHVPNGGALDIEDDVQHMREGKRLALDQYLLDVADLTNFAAIALQARTKAKKFLTGLSAVFLAISLIITYILSAYA